MKLLFDENLSPKLPRLLTTESPDSLHVRDIEMQGLAEEIIWEYAKNNNFTVISKDSDFYQPYLVWMRSAIALMGFGVLIARLRMFQPPVIPSHGNG